MAALDVQHSQRRSAVVVGPVALPSPELLTRRLIAMAEVGPETRIGLVPSTTSTRWRFAPDQLAHAVQPTSRSPDSDPISLVSRLRRLPERSLRVLSAGDHLVIDFSHGLGEIPLLDLLISVLLGASDCADDTLWAPYRHTVPPLAAAAVGAIVLAPHRLLPMWRQRRRSGVIAATTPPGSVAVMPSTATRVARIPADAVDELRRRRNATMPGVSLFAVYTCALYQALIDEGFDVEPTVTVPVDVRRYLPARSGTLGSFSAGLRFPLDSRTAPATLHDELSAAARTARPVANLLIGSLKSRVTPRSGHSDVWTAPARPRVQLLHSNIGQVPRSAWGFSDPAQARVLVASDPAGPCGVTVSTTSVLGTSWLTAEFHDGLFDANRVGAALATVLDRAEALLQSPSRR
ncbi:hypothetical protein [Mycobacterium sp. SMC-4]|uniref:hypothetical protein n=1 Tax=Mycobacterium sp. SMC-4 TaxID=2857059 RepID=UPI0021B29F8F|nr:hypothetical protein [Mycobacterium sp. SMC-4]UXA20216.1 hypothetical protein KXD98_11940 [Mycobacterium sp. SMC-4]